MSIIDLCDPEKVTSYVPAYVSDEATDAWIVDAITSESELIRNETGREIIPFADQPETRSFTLDQLAVEKRSRVPQPN